MNILVTIAARGGSKGIKGKNIRPLKGKPLIYYSIKQALDWGKARRVVVSTDAPDIAQVAKDSGALVPFMRPTELSQDTSPKGPVLKHAIMQCERIYGEVYDIVVDLDATAPIRTVDDLNNCLDLFLKKKPQTLFSVVYAHKNPYFNMVERNAKGNISLSKVSEPPVVRRQDAPEVYTLNASIYFFDRNYLLEVDPPSVIADRSEIYVMDELSSWDIDREMDFKFLEFLLNEQGVHL